METWRKHRFVAGEIYALQRAIKNSVSEFAQGERVEFVRTAYSAYDSSMAFIFKDNETGELKTWFLHDDDPDETASLFAKNQPPADA